MALLSVKILKLISEYLSEQNLKQAFPSLCTETFKIILDIGPKAYTKLIIGCLDLVLVCFEKLFNEKSFKLKNEDKNQAILKITQMFSNQEVSKSEEKEVSKSEAKEIQASDKVNQMI